MIFVLFLFFLFFYSYSQNVKRWKINDSTFCEIQTDSEGYKMKKANARDSIQFFFLVNFFRATVKIVLGKDTLADTVLSTRREIIENGIKHVETDWFVYLPKVRLDNNHERYIYYLINDKKIRFPFKRGYLMVYFRYYPERGKNGKPRSVYSLEYTNEYLGRL